MKVIILDNEYYHLWADGFDGHHKKYIHYFPGDIFEVIPYRYNWKDFYEVKNMETLSECQKLRCPKMSFDKPIFWIEKRCTEIVYDDLPEELFTL